MRDEPGPPLHIPLVEEHLHLAKETVETGRVRVATRVVAESVPVEETLTRAEVRIERVPVDRLVDTPPAVRREGNRTIVPVIEEVLVKRIRLVEEVHLIAEEHETAHAEEVELRRTEVEITRD